MYTALSVARYIICYCNDQKIGISNLKLQKILYFVQAEFLVSTGLPCFSDRIEAWDFGPVVPVVYHQYKIYGSTIIPTTSDDVLSEADESILDEDKNRINSMIEATKGYSAPKLVNLTHKQSPWLSAYMPGCNNLMSNETIRVFFER